ncbi:MAG: hypothetical protein R3A10_02340 [Caldilineaceae bacterium]
MGGILRPRRSPAWPRRTTQIAPSLLRSDRGRGQHSTGDMQPQFPHPGGILRGRLSREILRKPVRWEEGCHPAHGAGLGRGIERGGGRRIRTKATAYILKWPINSRRLSAA